MQFTDTSSANPPHYLVSWDWDFDGLGTSTDQNPTFTFMDSGIYDVTLTVWDEVSNSDSITHTVTIITNLNLDQSFTATDYAQASIYSDSTRDDRQVAQSFRPSVSNLKMISLYLSRTGSGSPTASIEIHANVKDNRNRDIPSNTAIASIQISFSDISNDPTWIDFSLEASLTIGQKYWIVIKDDELISTSDYVTWWQKYSWSGNGETYENGEKAYSPNNGISWYPYMSSDRFFKTYGT